MFYDPIVDEIHKTRERIWKEAGESMDGLLEYYRSCRDSYGDRLVMPEQVQSGKKAKASPKPVTSK